MFKLRSGSLPRDSRGKNDLSRIRNQPAKFVTQADLLRYPVAEREQIAELLRILAAKPGNAENAG